MMIDYVKGIASKTSKTKNLNYHLLRTVTVLSSIINPTNPNFGQIWLRLGFGLEASDGGSKGLQLPLYTSNPNPIFGSYWV